MGDLVCGVRVIGVGDEIWLQHVLTAGAHWNARLVPLRDVAAAHAVDRFGAVGCTVIRTKAGIVTVDVPPSADGRAVDGLTMREDGALWHHDRCVAPPWRQDDGADRADDD